MSVHDVSRSADLNRSKYSPGDEDTSSPGVLRMEESESDSNRSPFHSDQEQKGSCESLSEGNFADEEDSLQEKTSSRRSFKVVSDDKEDHQLVPDSVSLPHSSESHQSNEKEHLGESEESLDTQGLSKTVIIEKDIPSEDHKQAAGNEKKFVGNLDVTELSDISDDENNFSNLSEEDKQNDKEKQYESDEKEKQSFNNISLDSRKSAELNDDSKEPNPDKENFVSDETYSIKSNEIKEISLSSDKDRKHSLKEDNSKETKAEEKLGFEDEISNKDKTPVTTSAENVETQPDHDKPAVYCNGVDSKEGETDEDTDLKETEETNTSAVLTEQTPTLTNVLRFDFIGENGNESGSSKASDTDCRKTAGKHAKQNECQGGAKSAEYVKEDSANEEPSKDVISSDNSIKNDILGEKIKPDLDESGGSKDLGNSSLDNLPESGIEIKSPASSLNLYKCTVQVEPLPDNLIPKSDSFIILPRSELMKRKKPRKPAPKMIPVKKRKVNIKEDKNADHVPKPARLRRKRRLPKRSEPVRVAPKQKRPPPRKRSRSFTEKTKDLPEKEDALKETTSGPKPKQKISKKVKVVEPKRVDKKVKALPRQTKQKLESEKMPKIENKRNKREKFFPENKSNSKSQPKKQNSKAIPSKRITRSSQRNK